jgi:RNA polymerase sigma-70 factor (ECF subfamily)
MTTNEADDKKTTFLALAAKGGDPDAVDRWYRADFAAVFRIALGFLASAADAEEAAREAMVRILDGLASFEVGRNYFVWRTTIVANLCRDRLRRSAARRKFEDRAADEFTNFSTESPERAVEQSELRKMLAAALARLPDREREVFVLRDLEGASTEAVASALGIGESTVRSLLALARRRLREILRPKLLGAGVDEREGKNDE